MQRSQRGKATKTVAISIAVIAGIYVVVGVTLFLLLDGTEGGVPGNVLLSLPSGHVFGIIISILMTVSCVGGYPLYMATIHEIVEGNWGEMTSNRVFITNPKYVVFRMVELLLISTVAALFPFFNDVLSFNILRA